jgi:hypothetical protein
MPRKPKKQASSAPDGFSEKSWNKLGDTWRTGAMSKQTEDLEQEILKAVRSMSNTTFEMKKDEKLEALLKQGRERKKFYTDSIAEDKAKLDFCVYLMNTRGAKVSTDDSDDTDANEVIDEAASG